MNGQEKITSRHLERTAIVYVRQSTLAQVREHRGSTERQYEQKAIARELGWPERSIEVIDEDQGKSATSAARRSGFQELVSEVAMQKCGAIFGVEVSRLSRSNADWYRLLDLCAANDTLVIDDGRVHDPSAFDDRLLLGLKGTMADSEIHMMLSRLQGGRYRKVLRGEFWSGHAPVGYVFKGARMLKDPDERIRQSVDDFFRRFQATRSIAGLVRDFTKRGVKFPMRHWRLEESHLIDWDLLQLARAGYMLRNPVYAGAFCYGRKSKGKPRWAGTGPWPVLLKDVVESYISWEQFAENQKTMQENRPGRTTRGAPRCGQALLQGIAFCGRCGRRMHVSYGGGSSHLSYYCRVQQEDGTARSCSSFSGKRVDLAVARRLMEVLNEENIEQALKIAQEVEKNHGEEERGWKLRIEAAEYEAQRSFRQYNAVEPENRIVARTLETAWNQKLEELERVKEAYTEWLHTHPAPLQGSEHRRFLELLEDFEQVWAAPTTTQEERKALLRLFVRDVTLKRNGEEVTIGIQWSSGMTEALLVPGVDNTRVRTLPAVVKRIRDLSGEHLDREIAQVLNREGYRTERKRLFSAGAVRRLRAANGIKKGHREEPGYYTPPQLSALLGVSDTTILNWLEEQKLSGERHGATHWIKLSPAEISELRNSIKKLNDIRN